MHVCVAFANTKMDFNISNGFIAVIESSRGYVSTVDCESNEFKILKYLSGYPISLSEILYEFIDLQNKYSFKMDCS